METVKCIKDVTVDGELCYKAGKQYEVIEKGRSGLTLRTRSKNFPIGSIFKDDANFKCEKVNDNIKVVMIWELI